MSDDPWESLPARINETEAAAREVLAEAERVQKVVSDPSMVGRYVPGWATWEKVERLAVLTVAQAAASRRILAEHAKVRAGYLGEGPLDGGYGCRTCHCHEYGTDAEWPCETMAALAAAYTKAE